MKKSNRELPFYVRKANANKGEIQKKNSQRQRRLGYSIEQFAELTGVGRTSIYKALRSGLLTARKVGTRTIITAADAKKYFQRLPFWARPTPRNRGRDWDY
jgi:excisionase family DNA binding protein